MSDEVITIVGNFEICAICARKPIKTKEFEMNKSYFAMLCQECYAGQEQWFKENRPWRRMRR